jgi:hypothetical protein
MEVIRCTSPGPLTVWRVHVTTLCRNTVNGSLLRCLRHSFHRQMQRDRQPRSGLTTLKRDFSSNSMTDTPPAPAPGPPTAPKRSALSDTLRKAIQDGIASREADKVSLASLSSTASQKRSLSPGAFPPPQKRQLPRSWGDFESFSQGTSQSSLYSKSRSSMSSVPPSDMSSHGHGGEPDPHSVPPFEIKTAQRPAEISLSDEQKNILELVMAGTNIFYTGSAGMLAFLTLIWPIPSLFVFYFMR